MYFNFINAQVSIIIIYINYMLIITFYINSSTMIFIHHMNCELHMPPISKRRRNRPPKQISRMQKSSVCGKCPYVKIDVVHVKKIFGNVIERLIIDYIHLYYKIYTINAINKKYTSIYKYIYTIEYVFHFVSAKLTISLLIVCLI